MNFTKLNNNGLVDGFGILTKCEKKTSSRGGAYLDMILSDNDGEISAKLWDYNENTHGKFETDMFVKFAVQYHSITVPISCALKNA
mgnify:CR=1 FL=1